MSEPTYSKTNLDNFITNYTYFNGSLNAYTTLLNEFTEQVNTLLSHGSGSNVTQIITETNRDYLKTKNGLLIAMDRSHGESDFSANKLNDIGGTNYFYVDPSVMVASDISFGPTGGSKEFKEGKIIQGGLDDLEFSVDNLISGVSGEYLADANIDASFVTNNSGCIMSDLYACDSYAKMNNKLYYGLTKDDTSGCYCYIFNSHPLNSATATITSVPATLPSGKNISYLGIMFDNTLCSLKESIYSDNFDNIYGINSGVTQIYDISSGQANCNKFTGSGPHNIRIDTLDVNGVCTTKGPT
jgi:hypothetical protein